MENSLHLPYHRGPCVQRIEVPSDFCKCISQCPRETGAVGHLCLCLQLQLYFYLYLAINLVYNLFFYFFLGGDFFILGPHPQHREVPRLGVESELQLPAYSSATATPDQSPIFDLHHSSRQRRILNPLSEAGDRTRILLDARWVRFC